MYEKRTYGDGSPERHTLNLYASGQLIATVTRQGAIATAFNEANRWKTEVAAASMYDGGSVAGAARKAHQLLRGALAHPASGTWIFLGLFAIFAAAVLAAALRPYLAWRAPRRRPVWRLATAPLALVFTLSACSGGAPGGGAGSGNGLFSHPLYSIAGDTQRGPALGTFFYHRNHINSSSVITDAAGSEVTRLVYLPFGEISKANSAGTDTVTSKFTGQEYDEESNLYFYGARYYDPSIGRFISADSVIPSLTDAQAYNRYAYARNNPIIYTDPTGHSWLSSLWHGLTAAATAVWNGVAAIGNAIASAAQWFGQAVAAGVRWLGNAAAAVYKFTLTAATYAWASVKATISNPYALAGLLLAVAISVATLNPGPLIIWATSTGASIAATSLALAAGVRNPLVLAAIGAVAGAAGGGVTDIWRLLGSGAMAVGIQALGLGKVASVVGTAMALANFLMQNSMSGDSTSAASKDTTSNPGKQPSANVGSFDGSGDGEVSISASIPRDLKPLTDSLPAKVIGVVGGGVVGGLTGLIGGLLLAGGGEATLLGITVAIAGPVALTVVVIGCVAVATWGIITAVQSGIDIGRGNYYGGPNYGGRRPRRRRIGRRMAMMTAVRV